MTNLHGKTPFFLNLKDYVEKKKNIHKIAIFLIFALYFIIGLSVFRDYGLSWDEMTERITSLKNYTYVFEGLLMSSNLESVKQIAQRHGDLNSWKDRYYGVFLQSITVAVEHWYNFELSPQSIFFMRHAFTFLIYFIACIFFYLILCRRFSNTFVPIVGVLFYILYPRFFGESFYNIKDILFYSTTVIASYFVLRWLEDDKKESFLLPAAITLAIATNTRILGVSILLLACGFTFLQGILQKQKLKHNLKKSCHLTILTFIMFMIITPFLWDNPLKKTIDIFFHFLKFQPWDGIHLYFGEFITREVPWHYILVWMGITIPLIHIALFFVGFIVQIITRVRKHLQGQEQLYDMFFLTMFTCTLLGYILLGINMYDGWRHAYSIFLPFLYIAVCGLYYSFNFFIKRGKIYKYGFIGSITACLIYLTVWTIVNHPYQYVYFNMIGKPLAADAKFARDYWHVSNADLVRYALNSSEEPFVLIAGSQILKAAQVLTDNERMRFNSSHLDIDPVIADFFIEASRFVTNWPTGRPDPNFQYVTSINVDGIRIAALYKRVLPFTPSIDLNAWQQIVKFGSNISLNYNLLFDNNPFTIWSTHRPQEIGDYMNFQFREAVNFNYIYMCPSFFPDHNPQGLAIYTSVDDITWSPATIKAVVAHRHFVFESDEYMYLKIVSEGGSENNPWSVSRMKFGYVR